LGGTGYVVQQSAATFVTPTNALVMNDDDLIVQTLPFSFTHPGGTVTSVGHCSNGFVWLDNGVNLATPYWPDVNDLLTQGPRICPAWVDLDPGTSGTVYYDTTATAAYFTWSQVPLYVSSASLNTFQLQLHSDGRIIIVYQALAVPADSIVGYTRGTGANDPGSIDLSVTMPFPTGTGISSRPVLLTALESPAVGRTLPLEAYSLPASTTAGFLVLGLTPASINLSGLGMTNCTQYETIDSATFFVASPPSVIQPLAIPNQTWLVGFALRAQVAVLAAGITPLGVAATNAVAITIGNY
jgi:hypothetical protein